MANQSESHRICASKKKACSFLLAGLGAPQQPNAGSGAQSFRCLQAPAAQVLIQRRRDVFSCAVDADLSGYAHQGRAQQRVFADVDLLAIRQLRFHLFGQHRGSSETAHQLLAALGTGVGTPLIEQDGGSDGLVAAGDDASAIRIGQDVATIADPIPSMRLWIGMCCLREVFRACFSRVNFAVPAVGKNRCAILHWSCINANIIHIFLCLQCDIKICTVIANQILAVFTTLPTGLKLVVSKGRFAGQRLNWRGPGVRQGAVSGAFSG